MGTLLGVLRELPHRAWRAAGGLGVPLRRALLEVTVFVLVAIFNPFDIVGWSEMRSHDFWQRINADNYPSTALSLADQADDHTPKPGDHQTPKPGPVQARRPHLRGRDAITIFYFDDASVRRQYGNSPLTSFALLDLLDDITLSVPADAPPRAIFVDMALDDAGPEGVTYDALIADAESAPGADEKPAPGSYADQCERRPMTGGVSQVSPFRCLVIRVAQRTNYKAWRYKLGCQDSVLAKLVCIRGAKGQPLIFADTSTQLEKQRRFDDLPLSASTRVLNQIAMLAPATIDINDYPLVTPANAQARSQTRFQLYPAAALYAAWCDAEPCRESPIEKDGSGRLNWSEEFDEGLQVAWGIGPDITPQLDDPSHLLVHRPNPASKSDRDRFEFCTARQPGRINDIRHLVRMALSGVIDEQPACFYQRAFPSDIFQTASFSSDDATALVANKLIIIGAQFRASTDYVAAAPFGQVPGLYVHAMALDNLIESGAKYQKNPDRMLGDFTTNDLLNVIVLFFVALILAKARVRLLAIEEHEREGKWPPHRAHWQRLRVILIAAGLVLAFWVMVLALTRLPLFGLRIIPDNINAAAAMLLAVFGLLDLIGEALKPVVEAVLARVALAFRVLIHGPKSVGEGDGASHRSMDD